MRRKISSNSRSPEGEVSEFFASEFILVLRKSSWLVLGSILVSLGGLAFWFLGGRFGGPSSIGYATAAISTASIIVSLSTLGLNIATLKLVPKKKSKAFASAMILSIAIGVGAATTSIFFTGLLEGFAHYIPLIYLMVIAGMLASVSTSALVAVFDTKWVFLSNAMGTLAKIFAVIIFLYFLSMGGVGITLSVLTAQLVVTLMVTYKALLKIGCKMPRKKDIIETLAYGLANYPQVLSNQLIISTGVVLIAWLTGNASMTGIFYISLMIILVLSIIPSSMANLSLPAMEKTGGGKLAHSSMVLGSALILPLALFVGIAPKPILSLINKGFAGGEWGLTLLSLSVIPLTITINSIMYLNRKERLREIAYIGLSRLFVLVLLLFALAPRFGILGASASFLASTLVPLPILLKYDISIKEPLKTYVIQTILLPTGIVLAFHFNSVFSAFLTSIASLIALHYTGIIRLDEMVLLARTIYKGK